MKLSLDAFGSLGPGSVRCTVDSSVSDLGVIELTKAVVVWTFGLELLFDNWESRLESLQLAATHIVCVCVCMESVYC